MNKLKQTTPTDITPDYLFKQVLSAHPVLNDRTSLSAVMSPADGHFYAVARNVNASRPAETFV